MVSLGLLLNALKILFGLFIDRGIMAVVIMSLLIVGESNLKFEYSVPVWQDIPDLNTAKCVYNLLLIAPSIE